MENGKINSVTRNGNNSIEFDVTKLPKELYGLGLMDAKGSQPYKFVKN